MDKLTFGKSVLIYISIQQSLTGKLSVASLSKLFTASATKLLILILSLRALVTLSQNTLPSSLSFSATGSPSIELPTEQ